jgi:large subunit ribosomal protein L10
MPSTEKVEKVTALKERIQGSEALLLAEYRGLSVHDATELRRSLSEQARFSVVKNTLMQRAAADAGIEELGPFLVGPTAVAFVDGDVVAAAKKVAEATKRFPALVLKAAYLDGKVLDGAQAQSLASLDSREVMLSKIAGMLKSEMTRAAGMFQAVQSRFLRVLDAYKGTLASEAPAAEPTTEPAEETAEPTTPPAEPTAEDAAEPMPEPAGDADTDETPGEPADEPAAATEPDESGAEPAPAKEE